MAGSPPARRLRVVEEDPARRWRTRLVVAGLWLVSLALVWLWLRATIAPQFGEVSRELAQARRALAAVEVEKTQLQKLVSQHERGEQVARGANQELQQALAARQEEIASLRNDLSFYQRLMEGGAQQPGVSVHSLALRATDDPRAFQFALTLSQNLKRNRQASADDAKRSMQVREELEAQVRGIDTRLTPSAQDAVAYLERYRAVAERCQREGLAGLSTAIAELCKTAAGPHRFAGPAADEALAEVDGDLDTMEQAKVPQAAKGEVWFDNGKTGFLDVVAWVEPRLAQIDRLATAGGVTADTASRRARATQLATAFADALAAAAKKDAMPKGLITSPTITETAVNWIDDDGKVIRAGVEKASVRSVKNDFGVVTGKSGNGWAVYQPPDKPYCYLRGFEAYAEADGRRWQLSSRGKVEMLRVTRCK